MTEPRDQGVVDDELDPDVPTDPVPTHPDDTEPIAGEDDAAVAHEAPEA